MGTNNANVDDGHGGRRVDSKRRTPPDLRKLSRAFIALAQAQAEAEAQAQAAREHRARAAVEDSLDADVPDRKAS